ncbi:hypothetical protein HYX19_02835 [Candidatus Woesearchaeota archaeon]|nr:hypothetical protein [Candidatus Woesearchaeota archaeon]
MKYIFVLGRDPELSILEIVSYFKRNSLKYELLDYSDYALVLDTEELDFEEIIKRLGGTLKICRVISEKLPNALNIGSIINSDKIHYAISYYGQPRIDLAKLNMLIKKELKSIGYKKAYYKPSKRGTFLMPTETIKLLKEGVEFNVYSVVIRSFLRSWVCYAGSFVDEY